MTVRKLLFIISLILATAGSIRAQQKEAAFADGEKLSYIVSYRAKLVPTVEAGEITMRVSSTKLNGQPVYNIYANAKVLSHFRWFFDLDDTYQTWVDKSTLLPLKHTYRLREGKHKANCEYDYDWKNMTVRTFYHNLRKPAGRETNMKLTRDSYDAIALFYNMRGTDMGKLKTNAPQNVKLVLRDTIRNVTYRFLGEDTKTIKKLGTFKTLKFSCTIAATDEESFEDGSEFYVWITDDKNKIPIYLESPIKVGSVRATITKYENLKYPLTSKIK